MATNKERPDALPGDDVARLLRLAGPPERPSAAHRDTARAVVRAAWRQHLAARTRRRWIWIGVPILSGAAAVLAALVWWSPARLAVPGPVVARVAVVNGSLYLRRDGTSRPVAPGDVVRAGDVVETPSGAVAAFAMEGGGDIRQNSATSLGWLAPRRVALAAGHVYVDSGGSPQSVAIETSVGVVRDVGTRFDVRAGANDVRVRVRDGAVRFESPQSTRDVGAGQELLALNDGRVDVRTVATAGSDWDWVVRASSFRLDGATLDAFLTWIETESGRQLIFQPPSLRDEIGATILRGTVAGLSLVDALDTVLAAVDLVYRLDNGDVVIRKQRPGSRP
jgi:hypothetical protein